MVKNVFANPVFSAALICAILFYSGLIKLKDRNAFSCLFDLSTITEIEGELYTNPVKSQNSPEFYTADFIAEKAWSKASQSSATGTVKLLIPSEIVEKYYPGKLYTKTEKSLKSSPALFEKGNCFLLSVEVLDEQKSFFRLKEARCLGFKKGLSGIFNRFRALCRLQFKRLMFGWNKAGGLLLALLSGSREYTDSEVSLAFQNAGLSHILALSGMHLNLFGGLAFFFGNKITKRNTADLLELSAIAFFVWFAGLSPSLLRALISSIILYFNSLLRMKRFRGLTVLSMTFLIHLMIVPQHLKTAAFMLSYGALAGIMTVGQGIKTLISKRFFPKISSSLSESMGAQLLTCPVTVSLFGKIMPVGIISSVIVSPLVILFLYTGLLGTILCLILPFLSTVFNVIINTIYSLIAAVVFFFAKVPPVAL